MRFISLFLAISFSLAGAAAPDDLPKMEQKLPAEAPPALDISDAALRHSLTQLYKRHLVSLVVATRLDELEELIEDEDKRAEQAKKNQEVRDLLSATVQPAIDQALKIIVEREKEKLPENRAQLKAIGRLSHRGLELGYFASKEKFDAGKPEHVVSIQLNPAPGTATITDIKVSHHKR